MANLQVKDIDIKLYNSLKRIAKKDHRSISQEVINIIERYLNQPNNEFMNSTEEFLKLSGSWEDSRSSDEIIKDIRKSRNIKKSKKGRFNNGIFD